MSKANDKRLDELFHLRSRKKQFEVSIDRTSDLDIRHELQKRLEGVNARIVWLEERTETYKEPKIA